MGKKGRSEHRPYPGHDKRAKRVCIVRNFYYPGMIPNRRNAETLVANGYEVDVIGLKKKGEKSEEIIGGMRVYRLPIEHHRKSILSYIFEYFAFFLLASWKMAWLFLRRRYQIIEISGMPEFLVFTAIFPKFLGAKVILYVLDHTSGTFADKYKVSPGHWLVKLLRLIENISARWADYIIITQTTSKEILEGSGVPSSKISVVLNTPDESIFTYPSSPSNNGSHFCLITHGSILERYGIQTFIKAVPLLVEEIPQLKVKVVGDGEYRQQLEQLAQALGITKYVDFTGFVPQSEVPVHIAQAHIGVVVIPAGANPAMPNKLLEYMAMGKPAIVTTIPSIKAYFDDNTVMFYQPDNEHDLARCILELYRNPEKRAMLAATGSANYQKFRWSVMKHEYLKVFDKLIKAVA
jgi:glycosyltransferase involved in cell wall biosynthesis